LYACSCTGLLLRESALPEFPAPFVAREIFNVWRYRCTPGYNRDLVLLVSQEGRSLRRKTPIGRDAPFVPGIVAGIAFFIITVFIGGCGGEEASVFSEEDQGQVEQQKTEPEERPAASSTEQSAASIGDTITLGDAQWAATDVLRSDILVSRLGTEEGDFVIVDVTFTNNSNQDITLATPFATLLDSEGREYEAAIEDNFLHVYASENMFVDHVRPGATKEGKILFSVDDPAASGFKLQVGEARFASNETALIDLGI
jgi:Domain of unknown function (DUF4352)